MIIKPGLAAQGLQALLMASGSNQTADSVTCVSSNGTFLNGYHPPIYQEHNRPQIHFSPTTGFMNDPNGLVYSNGLWHLFFQYNPNDTVAGFQHWGHSVSSDLYHWQNLPMAIAPDNYQDGIFSGSAVLDTENTSGFFNDSVKPDQRMVAIYTLNTPDSEAQYLAYSSDGIHFTKYDKQVLSIDSTQFRDPKVFWDSNAKQWVMVVAHSQEYAVVFYNSVDLKSWKELSRFSTQGLLGYQYECPGLLQVPIQDGPDAGKKKWVLMLSINPGAPLGGSVVQYWIGDWDGHQFIPDDHGYRTADFSKDFYAFQSWYNSPDDKVYGIAWLSNWQYGQQTPTKRYRSIQSLPRQLSLKYDRPNPMFGSYVLTLPPANLDAVKDKKLYTFDKSKKASSPSPSPSPSSPSADCGRIVDTINLEGDGGFEIQATFSINSNVTLQATSIAAFKILSSDETQYITTGIQMGEPAVVYIDRRNAGGNWGATNPFFTDKTSSIVRFQTNYTQSEYVFGPLSKTQLKTDSTRLISLQAIVDRNVIEVFVNDGQVSGSSVFYFDNQQVPAKLELELFDQKIGVEKWTVTSLKSVWPTCP